MFYIYNLRWHSFLISFVPLCHLIIIPTDIYASGYMQVTPPAAAVVVVEEEEEKEAYAM